MGAASRPARTRRPVAHAQPVRGRSLGECEATVRWLGAVFEQSPVGKLLVHAPDGHIEMNEAARRLIGRTIETLDEFPADLVARPDGAFLGKGELLSVRALRGEHVDREELVLCTKSGVRVPIVASATPVLAADGTTIGAMVAFFDNSPTKELERLRAEWAAIVAHDLQQPINAISIYTQALARKSTDAELRQLLDVIRSSATRLGKMVHDLMDLSKLEAHRLDLARRPTDLVSLVRDTFEHVFADAPDRPLDLRVRGEIPLVAADPHRLAQVAENVFSNALKYGASGTKVGVAIARHEATVVLEISNAGQGLTPEQCARLFQRFQRSDDAKRSGKSGTGLGLYIARELIEAHGGRIAVESVVGGETTFRIELPV